MWITGDQLAALPPPAWLIEEIIPESAACALIGDPGMGKTFIALDMAAAVANGVEWHGHTTRSAPVAYVIAEGTGGMPERLRALRAVYPVDALAFWPREIPLRNSVQVDLFAQELAKLAPAPRLVVIDTLARCFVGGDENSAKDMGEFIHGVDRLRRLPQKSAVLVVHHSGHVKGRERGSTALRGAVDTLLLVQRANGGLVLSCEKQREARPFDPIGLALREVGVGEDMVSCVVDSAEIAPLGAVRNGHIAKAIEVLGHYPTGLTFTEWLECSGLKRDGFKRMLRDAKREGRIVADNGRYRRKEQS